ncbi:MAG: sugar ABC transporter substrate-binding protein, partial [Calditrichaeota bacterium]|nr:sugar ABC transporter substrate-binding protein [Calditrichota bacterium]
ECKGKSPLRAAVAKAVICLMIVAGITGCKTSGDAAAARPLRFVSLAWQAQSVEAHKDMVAQWNAQHPDRPVEYLQGTWSSIHDYLITAFETGDVPDVFHYESSVIVDFSARGFLADLAPMISDELKADVLDVAWASVRRPGGEINGIPFLMESFVVLYNRQMFEDAGIVPPTFENPWSVDELRQAAQRLTRDIDGDGSIDQYGAAMGLRNAANIFMNMSISFGGSFFHKANGKYTVQVGAGERRLLELIHGMLYRDRTMSPSGTGKTGSAMIPGLFNGNYAMLIGIGAWARQQLAENAPEDFRWGVFLLPKAESRQTGINTQTLSIPAKSSRRQDAMAFIDFMVNPDNMARNARCDWMLPTRRSCLNREEFRHGGHGWDIVSASAKFLSTGPWLGAPGYVEWKTRVANPILQEFFANRIDLDEAAQRLETESNWVLARYQMRGETW